MDYSFSEGSQNKANNCFADLYHLDNQTKIKNNIKIASIMPCLLKNAM